MKIIIDCGKDYLVRKVSGQINPEIIRLLQLAISRHYSHKIPTPLPKRTEVVDKENSIRVTIER